MILSLKNISVKFASGHNVQAVKDVSLDIEEKSKVAIVGETGSGKSILLLAILRLLPENAIVSGQAFFTMKGSPAGVVDLMTLKRKELDHIRGACISYIPQGSGNGDQKTKGGTAFAAVDGQQGASCRGIPRAYVNAVLFLLDRSSQGPCGIQRDTYIF